MKFCSSANIFLKQLGDFIDCMVDIPFGHGLTVELELVDDVDSAVGGAITGPLEVPSMLKIIIIIKIKRKPFWVYP